MKKSVKLTVLLALVTALTACSSQPKNASTAAGTGEPEKTAEASQSGQTAGADNSTLTVAYRTEAANLDPHNNQSLTAFSLEMLIYDRLVEKNADGEIVPSLAESWEVIDDTTIRFHLRKDVSFSNGEKLTAEDVKYTIERAETMPNSGTGLQYLPSGDHGIRPGRKRFL